jgi:hypothetical protein
VVIANAKWRRPQHRLAQGEVLLLQQVRNQIGAHKALLLTNADYSEGARAAAEQIGIGLHIVRPAFTFARLHHFDPVIIRDQLASLARMQGRRPLYEHEIVRKGSGSEPSVTGAGAFPAQPPAAAPAFVPCAPLFKALPAAPPAGYVRKTFSGGQLPRRGH